MTGQTTAMQDGVNRIYTSGPGANHPGVCPARPFSSNGQ